MPPSTPFVFVGDMLGQPTGLSRILTDLAVRLRNNQGELGLDVRVVGWVPWPDLPPYGASGTDETGSPCWYFSHITDAACALTAAYRSWFGDRAGIVMTIWDLHRCWGVLTSADLPVNWWGYIPVDGATLHGTAGGGPVRDALLAYTRVLAYTAYGAKVIDRTLLQSNLRVKAKMQLTTHLPHGLNEEVWALARVTPETLAKVNRLGALGQRAPGTHVIGTVATNQRRKDWGLVAQVLAELSVLPSNGPSAVHGWWHTDAPVAEAWCLPQLVEDFGLQDCVTITTKLTDAELAALYSLCSVTIAPGRGEGFGYPIVESQAMGTPVVHGNYAGGAELTPRFGRVFPELLHAEGAYNILRPILNPTKVAGLVEMYLWGGGAGQDRETIAKGVRDLGWDRLWPRWLDWFKGGL